jgi:hypothetical protein
VRLQRGGIGRDVRGEHVVRDQIAHALEPERRELCEYFALVGDARSEDVIERGDAIGRDQEEVVTHLINVADLAASVEFQIGEGGLEEWRGREHGKL